MENLLIFGGRVIDPKNNRDGFFDLLITKGKIAKISKKIIPQKNFKLIPAQDQWVMPGLVDAHTHLREPGKENSETIFSGAKAAVSGGVTTLLAMANTSPPIDTPKKVKFVLKRAQKSLAKVYTVGAVTQGLNGKKLTDFSGMAKAGCAAFSDDGRCVMDSGLLRTALEKAKKLGKVLIEHCEEHQLSQNGSMNESSLSQKLGICGIPSESEAVMVARDIFLAQLTRARLHCAHLSCKDSVELIRAAKKKGIPISAETCPHYFTMTEAEVKRHGTFAKMKPPLRTQEDVKAIKEALIDGTIDLIATDHAPHSLESKKKSFEQAPFGIIGLETLFVLVYEELILKKVLSPISALRLLTENPAARFGLPAGHLTLGAPADLFIFNPQLKWTYKKENVQSKSMNSPFLGRTFKGKVRMTLVNGKIVFQA